MGAYFCRAVDRTGIPGDVAVDGALSGVRVNCAAHCLAGTRASASVGASGLAYRLDAHYDGQPHLLLLPCQCHSTYWRACFHDDYGTLPVVIPVFANLLYSQRDGKLAWGKLAPALICIGIGLASVNIAELNHGLPDFDWARYTSGIVLALVSVVCWAWYALRNARWLRENPDKHPMMWATAQALVTLPVSLIGYLVACYWLNIQTPDFSLPFGPRPLVFISLMIAIAVLCSWVGALCWNVASQRLPTVILGPLIVFETLAGLLYTFLLSQQMPPLMTLSGIALLVIGVVIAVRAKPEKPLTESVSES